MKMPRRLRLWKLRLYWGERYQGDPKGHHWYLTYADEDDGRRCKTRKPAVRLVTTT